MAMDSLYLSRLEGFEDYAVDQSKRLRLTCEVTCGGACPLFHPYSTDMCDGVGAMQTLDGYRQVHVFTQCALVAVGRCRTAIQTASCSRMVCPCSNSSCLFQASYPVFNRVRHRVGAEKVL